jgi:hypothetical protein
MPRKKASAGGRQISKMLWDGIHAISLECRIKDQPVVQTGQSRLHNVNDLQERAMRKYAFHVLEADCFCRSLLLRSKFGGARRDRTDDLMLAKHALSQLSYDPVVFSEGWLAKA